MSISELGYLGISVSNGPSWRRFAQEILGMQVLDEGEPGRFYLRMDLWHHRIVVHEGGNDDLAYVGWRVSDPVAFRALYEKLISAGVEVRIADDQEAQERRVLGLMKMLDPGGIPTEIFYSPQVDSHKPLVAGRPLFGHFRTGSHGLGHCMFREPDEPAATRFYELLGFTGAVEYLQQIPNGPMLASTFMHCNDRQHSVAFLSAGPKKLLHVMFEYDLLEDLGQTYDAARDNEVPLITSLGMHANDRALTFYMVTPSGWAIEPGWNGRTPPQQEHHRSDVFGHDLVNGQYVGNIPFRPR